ncbi:MAG: hypothetical protein LBF72_01870 [Holosporales bacterium]|nr:hypothetical protein [Holosporales bacterium]
MFISTIALVIGVLPIVTFAYSGSLDIGEYLLPMLITGFVGGALVFANANRGKSTVKIDAKNAFLLTTLLWLAIPVFAGLPFFFHKTFHLSFIDSCFEAASALTTTGFSVLKNSNTTIPMEITVWRFILSYIGGIGIVLMGMVIFPILHIGGMSLFRRESSEKGEKVLPRISQIASVCVGLYSLVMVICSVLLRCSGIEWLDAVCHAVSAVSTCGFSTHSGQLSSYITPFGEFVLIAGMIFGGSPILLFVKMLKRGLTALREDEQFTGYIRVCLFGSAIVVLFLLLRGSYSVTESVRKGVLNAVSVITTTGFCNDISFEHFGAALFFFCSFIGGCTGSTSGGLKIFRLQIILELIKVHVKQSWKRHNRFIPIYMGQKITENIASSVYVFFILYFLSILAITGALTLFNFDLWSALSAAVATIGNVGMGFGDIVGTNAQISAIPYGAKLILMFGMILGRLELLTVLILFSPAFWKR